jgi:hypothetical protein
MNQPLFSLQIGTLSNINQPALIPFNQDCAIVIAHNAAQQTLAYELCEAMLLQLLHKQATGQAKILFYEAAPSPQFAQLKRLYASTEHVYGEQLGNLRVCIQQLTQLNAIAQRRFSLLASSHCVDIASYNAQSPRPEPIIYLLISDITPFCTEAESLHVLQNFCLNAVAVGIVPVLLHNSQSLALSEFKQTLQQQFWHSIQTSVLSIDLTAKPVSATKQPAELWRLFAKFTLHIGIDKSVRHQWTDALIARLQTQTEANADSDFLRIPIGTDGAKTAYFCLGEQANAYHAMIGGASRSGKSTLLNNLILSFCETYSPEQLRLWLFDYREGVEFNIFADLAHIDALHIDNDNTNYALNAFTAFEELMKQRAQLFKTCQPPVARLVDYNQFSNKPLPRCVLIIDEAQVIFENRDTKRAAQQLLRSVARRGAAFGLHILLSTQSYQNVDLDSDIKAQFRLRIGLQLANSSECRALMGHDNDAPLNLARYHAVYNNNYGYAEPRDNRLVALDSLTREQLWQRLQALKARYPKNQSAFDFSTTQKVEKPNPKANDEFADWDDLS